MIIIHTMILDLRLKNMYLSYTYNYNAHKNQKKKNDFHFDLHNIE